MTYLPGWTAQYPAKLHYWPQLDIGVKIKIYLEECEDKAERSLHQLLQRSQQRLLRLLQHVLNI